MVTAPDHDERTGLERDLGWALGRVFRTYVKTFDAALDRLPGGPRGYQILAAVTRATPPTQLALANRLGIDRTVMTYLLDDLCQAGLVERQADPADRRARRIVATRKGENVLASLERHLAGAEEHLLSPLDEDGKATLRALLQQVAEHIQRVDPVASTCDVVDEIRAK
ncbi:winged helix-turn-helix transcriptional regulator [Phytoactinopolyspora alkaliphila]|uniref:Winged helix-turn-helix transcriptional regulator n=1 Tax=Phytoactinopolyspora alkaliphila TaxID=1783498 RepID=A0A6N9YR44_9ACTN|nr:MarR family winged helix-turn-helix transcriptional regulator [Phytoactinopolyspora alkaliphila]NED97454.1 winged helix-turn-helix transcriptional regulator [Phytoactinopolyspora alkaliphila]